MPYSKNTKILLGYLFFFSLLFATPNQFPESPGLPSLEDHGFFAGLTLGDSREIVLEKLQKLGYLGYKELQSGLIKSPVRWNGHAYELTCKFNENDLALCLIQGEGGRIFSTMIL